ncbi:MAG: hypothetical protein V4858_01135 [Pseudomonadota bacterium]
MSMTPLTPIERLAISREHVRHALSDYADPDSESAKRRRSGDLVDAGHSQSPRARGAVRQWWAHHPLHWGATLTMDVLNTFAKSAAQRNPIALVAGAMLLGGAVVWVRAWRWTFRSGLLAALLPALANRIVAQLPLRAWLGTSSSMNQIPCLPKPVAPTNSAMRHPTRR